MTPSIGETPTNKETPYLFGGPKHDTWQGKGVNEHKGETSYLVACGTKITLGLVKGSLNVERPLQGGG